MKKKVLATIAAGLVIFGGVFTPVFGVITPELGTRYAQAAGDDGNIDSPPQPSSCGQGIGCEIMSAVSEVIMFVPTALATVSGLIFDYTIWNSIQSGTYTKYDGAAGDDGIVVAGWKLVRDFTNLLFIFALFVIGFTLILGLDGGEKVSMTSNPKRTLARVIIMALLVNFSFFMGRVVIDISNKLSIQFYNNMTLAPQPDANEEGPQKDVNSFYTLGFGIRSISGSIIDKIDPQSFLLLAENSEVQAGTGKYANLFFTSLISAFFGLFLMYIFISNSILFIGRTIGLYLGIIISPLAFVSFTVPFLQRQPYIGFDDWLKQFMGLAFMAPIFMFFMYIGIQFFQVPLVPGSGTVSIAAQVLFKFAAVAMFFTLAKRISKDMSGKIGDMSTSFVSSGLTSIATIGAAAATGGTSAAWLATKREAASNLQGIGQRTIGNERTEALQQRLGGLRNFKDLGKDPRRAMAGLATAVTGSKVPGQIYDGSEEGRKLGRAINIKNIREERLAREAKEASDKVKAKTAADSKQRFEEMRDDPVEKAKADYNKQFEQTADGKRMKELVELGMTTKDPVEKAKQDKEYEDLKAKRDAGMKEAIEKATTPAKTPTPTNGVGVGPRTATPGKDAELKLGPKNSFNPDVKIGQPETTQADQQKEESEKLTSLYDQNKKAEGEVVKVNNLTVNNLTVASTNMTRAPMRPTRNSSPANGTVQQPARHAENLLSKIQSVPTSTSSAVNYKSTDFKTDNDSVFGDLDADDIMREQLKPEPKQLNPITDIDHTGTVLENLPGDNGNFDFGGMGRKDADEEE